MAKFPWYSHLYIQVRSPSEEGMSTLSFMLYYYIHVSWKRGNIVIFINVNLEKGCFATQDALNIEILVKMYKENEL